MKYFVNFKMNKTLDELQKYFEEFDKLDTANDDICFFVSPSLLYPARSLTKHSIGAQNIAHLAWGAMTGETSIIQVNELGIQNILIGHSDRRQVFFENDEAINSKVKLASKYNMTSVLCVGEDFEDKDNYIDVVLSQIASSLVGIKNLDNIIIAYEPVWAINGLKDFDIDYVVNAINAIKGYMSDLGVNSTVLYGGGVKLSNIKDLKNIPTLDGFLVSSIAFKPHDFYKVIKA